MQIIFGLLQPIIDLFTRHYQGRHPPDRVRQHQSVADDEDEHDPGERLNEDRENGADEVGADGHVEGGRSNLGEECRTEDVVSQLDVPHDLEADDKINSNASLIRYS